MESEFLLNEKIRALNERKNLELVDVWAKLENVAK